MAKKTSNLSTRSVAKRGSGYAKLVKAISQVNTGMVTRAAVAVNQALVLRNWLIGAYIVEFEQNGSDRAKYGARLLPTLAEDLKAQGLKGLGAEMLRSCRSFFLCYPQISQPVVGELALPGMPFPISQPLYGKLEASADAIATRSKGRRTQEALPSPLSPEQLARISWTHFLGLIYNLDITNPHIGESVSHDPGELLATYSRQQSEIQALRDQLKSILSEALSR